LQSSLRGTVHGLRRRRCGHPHTGIRVSSRPSDSLRNSVNTCLGIRHHCFRVGCNGFRLRDRRGFQHFIDPFQDFLIDTKQCLFQKVTHFAGGLSTDLADISRVTRKLVSPARNCPVHFDKFAVSPAPASASMLARLSRNSGLVTSRFSLSGISVASNPIRNASIAIPASFLFNATIFLTA